MLNRFVLLLLVLVLSSCGFHLKGVNKLPAQLHFMHLIESDDAEFNKILLKQLKASGVTIVDDVETILLSVKFKTLPEIIVAKSSSTGLQIKQLSIQLQYSVKNKSGEWLVEQKLMTQSRDFESDTNQLLAKNNEKKQIYQQMKKNLVSILIYQLQLLS